METGHLDRVLQGCSSTTYKCAFKINYEFLGVAAEEVLYACEEHEVNALSSDVGMANPALHFFRYLVCVL